MKENSVGKRQLMPELQALGRRQICVSLLLELEKWSPGHQQSLLFPRRGDSGRELQAERVPELLLTEVTVHTLISNTSVVYESLVCKTDHTCTQGQDRTDRQTHAHSTYTTDHQKVLPCLLFRNNIQC